MNESGNRKSQVKELFFLARAFAGLHAGRNNTLTALRKLLAEKDPGQNYFQRNGKTICIYLNPPQQIGENPNDFESMKSIVESRIKQAEEHGAVAVIMALQLKGSKEIIGHFKDRYKDHFHLAYLRVELLQEWDELMKKTQAVWINRIVDRPHETAKVLWQAWKPHLDAI